MKLVYIAGKYTGANYSEVEGNIKKAEKGALKLLKDNHDNWFPIIPHMNTAHFEMYDDLLGTNYKYWLKGTLEILKRCDAIYMLKDWKESKGAVEEFKYAINNNITLLFEEQQ